MEWDRSFLPWAKKVGLSDYGLDGSHEFSCDGGASLQADAICGQ